MNRLQEQSVIFCLNALNNLAKNERITQSKPDQKSLTFQRDLNALVIQMAHANSDMVDTFFIIRFILKLSETQDLGKVVSEENLKKIMDLFTGMLHNEERRVQIVKYYGVSELYKIAKAFGKRIDGLTELLVQRFLETAKRINTAETYQDVFDLKAAVERDLPQERRDEVLNLMLDKIAALWKQNEQSITKDFYTVFALQSFPNGEKKKEVVDLVKIDNFEEVKFKNSYRMHNRVLEILKTFNQIEFTSFALRNSIEKMINECALENGVLNWKNSEL